MSAPDGDRYQRAVAIFERACDLPTGDRDAFLREQSRGDAGLYEAAQALLAHDGVPNDPVTRAASHAAELLTGSDGEPLEDAFTPERIGGFRILRRIGEGGMGIVFEAEQSNPHRIVALKVVRPGMTTPNNLRRFELEAEALARLEHTAIARIYEAGTAETPWGRVPYFAMERVQGRPIVAHCTALGLDLRERVALLARVCDAIEHAHAKGVIHRDLKSSNVLVGEDGDPKVLDFGIARLVERTGEPRTELTMEGQIVGTLATMSPEQVRGDVHRIDGRTDVYSLGAIGYELLAGRPPLPLEGKSFTEAARMVEEVDPPQLSTIVPECRGDLDVIVGKALDKDPERRYASAAALAADLTRYLRDEPILARPPSATTLLRKFARRNRAPFLGAVIALVALVAGAGVSIWKAIDATNQRELATSRAFEAEGSRDVARRQAYRANLVGAAVALQSHDVGEARRRLEEAPESLRGWEWEHLRSRLDESLAACRLGGAAIACIDVSPDGRYVAAGTSKGSIEIWSIDDGKRVAALPKPGAPCVALRFSEDGTQLHASSATAKAVRFTHYDVPQLSERGTESRASSKSREAVFSANGARLLRILETNEVTVEDPASAAISTKWKGASRDATPTLDARGELVALADPLGFGVNRVADGSVVFRRDDAGSANSVSFRADGAQIVVAMFAPEALICEASTGATIRVLSGHNAGVSHALFSPDGRTIATTTADGTVRLWDAERGTPTKTYHGHAGPIQVARFTRDGSRLVTGGADGTVRIWGASSDEDSMVLKHPESCYGVAFSPDGERLATVCLNRTSPSVFVWDVPSGNPIASWGTREGISVAWSPTSEHIAAARHNMRLVVHDAATGATVARGAYHNYNTDSLAFDPAGARLFSSGLDGVLAVDEVATGKPLHKLKLGQGHDASTPNFRIVVSARGGWIAASGSSGAIVVLDLETYAKRRDLRGATSVVSLAASPDGRLLAAGSSNGEIQIWNVADGSTAKILRSHFQEVFGLAFSPDGTRFVSGGRDRAIRVWATDRWEEIVRLVGHTSFVYALAFSPDGKILASAGGDDTVRLWDTRTRAERHLAHVERERILGDVAARVEEAFLGNSDQKLAIASLRAAPGLDARSREVALQEGLRRCVESRPAPR